MSPESRLPRLNAPEGTCDTHIHFYDKRYEIAPTARGIPADARVEDYRVVRERLGITRSVVVQPTAYGLDNSCTLDGIAALGADCTRGVAVVDESVTLAELDDLTQRGMRGVRFHMLPGGALGWDRLDAVARKVWEVGWHVQLQLDGRTLPDREAQISAWPGMVVIDHVGKFVEPVGIDDAAFRCMVRLVESGRVFVKLSVSHDVSKREAPHYEDLGRLAKELVRIAPERMMWASNWPHPSAPHKPDAADLLDLLLSWAPDDATRRTILVDNPARVYGFQ